MKVFLLVLVASLSIGCVGIGMRISPADGRISLDFQAQDCISDNVVGRFVGSVPGVGDWAMLNYGCKTSPLIPAAN